jgi:dienelactone hydrolase
VRNYSPWAYWMLRLAGTSRPDPLPVDDLSQFGAWRDRCRDRLAGLLGPMPEGVAPRFEVLSEEPAEGYCRQKVVFDTEPTMSVPAYLLIPDERAAAGPAVVAVHGHGPGKAAVCGVEPTEAPNGDYAVQLVRRGFVVLAPDLRCFGERRDWNPPDHYACDTNLVHALMAGVSPLSQNLWDLMCCVDVLQAHPLVDPGRVGAAGLSYGGTLSLFLAAWDDRVKAAVVSGYLSSWADSHKVPWNMCGSQVLTGVLGQLEHVDLGAMVAPRPLLVETGTEDMIFPLAAAQAAVRDLGKVYAHAGAAAALEHDVFTGGHHWHGARAYPFLQRWL